MTRILVIGAVAAEKERLDFEAVRSVQAFRELTYTAVGRPAEIEKAPAPAPQFGSARPYLKRKKGRA